MTGKNFLDDAREIGNITVNAFTSTPDNCNLADESLISDDQSQAGKLRVVKPRGIEKKNRALTVSFKQSTFKGLQKIATDTKISLNEAINQIVDIYIKTHTTRGDKCQAK